MSTEPHDVVASEPKRLVDGLVRAVSFEARGTPSFERIHRLIIEPGLLGNVAHRSSPRPGSRRCRTDPLHARLS